MNFTGVMPAITTAFKSDMTIDHRFVARHAQCPPSACLNLFRSSLHLLRAPGTGHHIGARICQTQGNRAAKPRSAAHHHGEASGQIKKLPAH